MPVTRCPHCRDRKLVRRDLIGQRIGCPQCERLFTAQEYTGPGPLQQLLSWLVVGGALGLAYLWYTGRLGSLLGP